MIDTLETLGLWSETPDHDPSAVTPEDERERAEWYRLRLEIAREMERTRRLCEDTGAQCISASVVGEAKRRRQHDLFCCSTNRERLSLQMMPLKHWIDIVQKEVEGVQ